jgi:hypothetical protein
MAVEEEKRMTKAWKPDVDDILIFVSICLLPVRYGSTISMGHRLG